MRCYTMTFTSAFYGGEGEHKHLCPNYTCSSITFKPDLLKQLVMKSSELNFFLNYSWIIVLGYTHIHEFGKMQPPLIPSYEKQYGIYKV